MRKKVFALALATALVIAPHKARADGDAGAAAVVPFSIYGGLELWMLGGGTALAIGSRIQASAPHPNRNWFTATYVFGATNLVIGGLYAAAFIDACFKVDTQPVKVGDVYVKRSVFNVFDNNLNVLTFGLAVAHVSVAALDWGFAISGSTSEPRPASGSVSRVSIAPLVAFDHTKQPVIGLSVALR
jgi:hypothetical protein